MSKLQRLRDNIAAIECALKGENNPEVLSKYSGFGGMGFILNGVSKKEEWSKSDHQYYDDTMRLFRILWERNGNEEFDAWIQSLKASTLTAYYTPKEIIRAMERAFAGIDFGRVLDPAAGNGVFIRLGGSARKTVAYEKDLLTGLLLKRGMYGCWDNVEVRVKGFETFPNEELATYDLVTTNVPFGNISVFDADYDARRNTVYRAACKMIHKYYVLKGLNCLRDGGIEAFIITSNYLNRDDDQLSEALKQSRLIGAYRLANNLFKEAGTEVGTDLLVLQKDTHKQGITADESMLLTQYEDAGCPTNMYFTCYPDHVIATSKKVDTDAYGKPGFIYTHDGGVNGIADALGKVLAADMTANCDVTLFEKGSQKMDGKTQAKQEKKLSDREKGLLELHKVYTELYNYEAKELQENNELRKQLNQLYDEFCDNYGCLSNCHNSKAIKELKINDLSGLEYRDEKGMPQKADILLKPIAFSTDDLHEAKTSQEALAQSLNDYGKPDMRYMAAMTGKTEAELIEELRGEVFYDPLNEDYAIKAKFICGNVIEKLEAIKAKFPECDIASGKTDELTKGCDPRVADAISALEDAVPTPIPFEDLDFNLGERWVDVRVYEKFATDFFSMPENPNRSWDGGAVEVTIKYNPLLDQFACDRSGVNEKVRTQYAITPEVGNSLDGIDLLTHALHNSCPKFYRYQRDALGTKVYDDKYDEIKEEDPEKIQLANSKIEEIRQGYVDWLQKQPKEFRDHLADVYNRRFNCFVKPKYDGSHQQFPGIDLAGLEKKFGIKSIYQSQKDCVWMLLCNGGGICDHEVGSGKTLIMCMAAHEMKRLGLAHKPMIIGLKANVSAIADTYRTAYPQAKILFATEADYSSQNRVDFFNRLKNNDWDCVIMSHDQFGRIPQSEEMQLKMLEEELEQLEEALDAYDGWSTVNRKMRRGLEIRKRNKTAKILELQNSIRKRQDEVVDFALMGIDHIFIDESHQFKNLGFATRHDRVAGIGNTEGSKRAFNLLTAIRTIQRRTGKDLGATFLSGTTVTNSLTELYSLFRYLRPQALAKQNISCFDAWAAIFTKKSQEFEFSITNTIQLKERFRYFIKVPELAMFYNEITDFRTAEDVGIERPEKHAMLLNIKPTPDQEEFIHRLMEFAKTGDFSLIGIEAPTDKQQKAKMLYATDMARKMSLDMRMIDQSYGDHPRSKASKCAQLIKRYYDQYNEQKGVQLVFSDLSCWKNNTDWSVYSEIKHKLVNDYGIPSSEIRFIQECKSDSAKQKMIADTNAGKIRVLFGSTSMLGTGVNAQQRVVAVHHLDTPWRPSDLEQRDGRAIRKGNEVAKLYADNKVDIIIYAVERSLDSYKFNLLHCKQTFINQLKRGQLSIRTLDEGAMDENTGMNFAEYMAVLSGNRDLLERAKLEKKIAGLESERKNFLRDQREQAERREKMVKENELYAGYIATVKADMATFMKAQQVTEEGIVLNCLTLDGFEVPEGVTVGTEDYDKAMGERLMQIERTARTSDCYIPVGEIYGFRVLVRTREAGFGLDGQMAYENRFFVESSGELKYSYNDGYLNHASPRISGGFMLKALQLLPERITSWEQRLENNRIRIEQLSEILTGTWPKEAELRLARADLGILDRKINEDLKRAENHEPGRQAA